MTRSVRIALAGLATVAGYAAVASATLGPDRPLRPFFDGSAPPVAYRWVNPPPELAATNQPPSAERRTFAFVERKTTEGRQRIFEGGSITTADGQATVSVPAGIFADVPGQTGVRIEMEPVDAETVAPPPEGLVFDGNGMRITATLVPSGESVDPVAQDCSLGGCVTVALRYPAIGTDLVVGDGGEWTELDATNNAGSLQVFGSTTRLGTFVAVAPPPQGHGLSLSSIVAFVAGGIAVLAAVGFTVLRRRSSSSRAKPTPGKRGRSGQARPASKQTRGKGATRGSKRR